MKSFIVRGKMLYFSLMLLSITGGLWAQYNYGYKYNLFFFEPSITDGRGLALGHTSLLSSRAANNVFNNPAALSQLSGTSVIGSIRMRGGETTENGRRNTGYYEKYTNTWTYKLHAKLNGLAFAMPLHQNIYPDFSMGLGIGYRPYYDYGSITDADFSKYDMNDDYHETCQGGFNVVTIAVGTQYRERLSGGLSYSFPLMSGYKYKTEVYGEDYYNEYNTSTDLSGSFFTFSSSYILKQSVIMAMRLRTGFKLAYDEDYSRDQEYDGNQSHYEEHSKTSCDIPYELCIAAQILPSQQTTLFVEYLTRNLSKVYEGYDDNGFAIRAGIEYDNVIKYRIGTYYQSVPYHNGNYETGFTGGIGFSMMRHITSDIYGCYSYCNGNTSIEENISRYQFGCSVGYNL